MMHVPPGHFDSAAVAPAKLPDRPDAGVLHEAIPLFFIGRNKNGLWVAREAKGRAGGIFLFRESALHFAERSSAPIGCATMFLAERFELDVENEGNRMLGVVDAAIRVATERAPRLATCIAGLRPQS
jgi:hypothetical protein